MMQMGAAHSLHLITKVLFFDATANGNWLIVNWIQEIANKLVC